MADITMCVGAGCPLREKCYRFTATPDPLWQSFADFTAKVVREGEDVYRCPERIPGG